VVSLGGGVVSFGVVVSLAGGVVVLGGAELVTLPDGVDEWAGVEDAPLGLGGVDDALAPGLLADALGLPLTDRPGVGLPLRSGVGLASRLTLVP